MATDQTPRTIQDSALARWGIVCLTGVTMMVNYYFYDALSPLKEILTVELGWTSKHYGFFTSAYAVPNTFLFMAVIGGIICDRIGIRITGVTTVVLMFCGTLLTWYGSTAYFNQGGVGHAFLSSFAESYPASLKMMFLGFVLFGLGAETSLVIISKVIVKWFRGREVALALAISLALARGGTALAMVVPPRLLKPDWTRSLWVCVILMAIGALTFIIYTFFDRRFDRQVSQAAEEEEPFRLADVVRLLTNPSFVFIVLLCVTFYSAVFPFMKYAPDLMFNKYGMTLKQSGDLVAFLPLGTILFTPLFGWVVDYKGWAATLMILGSGLLVVVHLLFSLTYLTPWIPLMLLGIAFSLVPAALWPALAKLVDDQRLGTAYGLTFSIQNFGLWLFPILIGVVLDGTNPGVAQGKAVIGAVTQARQSAKLLTEADPVKTDAKKIANLRRLARQDADKLVKVKVKGVDKAYLKDYRVARPVAQAMLGAKTGAELRQHAARLVALKERAKSPTYDYTQTVLMLAGLGLLGLVFAFLLRRADRRQGYGLDKPSKMKKDETSGSSPPDDASSSPGAPPETDS